MTTIDERLDNIQVLQEEVVLPIQDSTQGTRQFYAKLTPQAKTAIRTLFLDLIAEAKPEGYGDYYASDPIEKGKKMGYNEAINEFENNLIQAINGGKK